jgi:hypothetical protein
MFCFRPRCRVRFQTGPATWETAQKALAARPAMQIAERERLERVPVLTAIPGTQRVKPLPRLGGRAAALRGL